MNVKMRLSGVGKIQKHREEYQATHTDGEVTRSHEKLKKKQKHNWPDADFFSVGRGR